MSTVKTLRINHHTQNYFVEFAAISSEDICICSRKSGNTSKVHLRFIYLDYTSLFTVFLAL